MLEMLLAATIYLLPPLSRMLSWTPTLSLIHCFKNNRILGLPSPQCCKW